MYPLESYQESIKAPWSLDHGYVPIECRPRMEFERSEGLRLADYSHFVTKPVKRSYTLSYTPVFSDPEWTPYVPPTPFEKEVVFCRRKQPSERPKTLSWVLEHRIELGLTLTRREVSRVWHENVKELYSQRLKILYAVQKSQADLSLQELASSLVEREARDSEKATNLIRRLSISRRGREAISTARGLVPQGKGSYRKTLGEIHAERRSERLWDISKARWLVNLYGRVYRNVKGLMGGMTADKLELLHTAELRFLDDEFFRIPLDIFSKVHDLQSAMYELVLLKLNEYFDMDVTAEDFTYNHFVILLACFKTHDRKLWSMMLPILLESNLWRYVILPKVHGMTQDFMYFILDFMFPRTNCLPVPAFDDPPGEDVSMGYDHAWRKAYAAHYATRKRPEGVPRNDLAPPPPASIGDAPAPELQPQGATDYVILLSRIKNSPLFVRTYALMSAILGFGIFGTSEMSGLFANKAVALILARVEAGLSQTALIGELAVYASTCYDEYVRTGSWKSFFAVPPNEALLADVEEQIVILGGNRGPDIMLQLAKGRAVLMRTLQNKCPLIQTKARVLSAMVAKLMANLQVSREQPLGVLIQGPSGCGKTEIVRGFTKYWAHKCKYPDDIDTLHVVSNTKHQNLPAACLVLCFNDIFQIKDEMTDQPIMDALQASVEKVVYRVEAASIEDKETSAIAPDFVFGTTNTPSFNMTTVTMGANKLDRRFDSVKIVYSALAIKKWPDDKERNAACALDWCEENYEYHLGRMMNKEAGTKLHLEPKMGCHGGPVKVFHELSDLYLELAENFRKLRAKEGALSNACTHCYLPMSGGSCKRCTLTISLVAQGRCNPCNYFRPRIAAALVGEAEELTREILEEVNARLRAEGLGNITILNLVEDLQKVAVDMTKHRMDAVELVVKARLKLYAVRFGLLVSGLAFARVLWTMWPAAEPAQQGAAVSTPDVPKEDVYVRPMATTTIPWLGVRHVYNTAVIKNAHISMFATFLTPTLFLTAGHFFEKMVPGDPFTVSLGETLYQMTFYPKHKYGLSYDRATYFAPEVKGVSQAFGTSLLHVAATPALLCNLGSYLDLKPTVCKNGNRYYYEGVTKQGDCGLPLVDKAGMFYGIHVGIEEKGEKRGASSAFTLIDFKAAKNYYTAVDVPIDLYSNVLPVKVAELIDQGKGGLHPLSDISNLIKFESYDITRSGHVPLAYANVPVVGKMTCRKTTMYEHFADVVPTMCKPHTGKARQTPDGLWRSPDIYRMLAVQTPCNPDWEAFHSAVKHCIADYPVPGIKLEPLDFYRAIAGDPINALMNARDNSKAVGHALSLRGITKSNAFVKEGEKWIVHPEVIAQHDAIWNNLASDEPLGVDFVVATIKDEAYPEAKVLLCKGRYFYVADLAFNMVGRRLLLPLISYAAEHPQNTGIVITMNPGSMQWGALRDMIVPNEEEVMDMDQKEYDLRHNLTCVAYIEILTGFARKVGYSEKDVRMVRRFCMRAFRFILLMSGQYFMVCGTLPSGRLDTIFMNCTSGKFLIYYCRLRADPMICKTQPSPLLAEIRQSHTGDDNMVSTTKDSRLSPESVNSGMTSMGFSITDGDKGVLTKSRPIAELHYLKRKFVVKGTQCLAPLTLDSIYKSLAYVTGISEEEEPARNKSAMVCAVREMFMHGETMFDDFMLRVRRIYPSDKFPTFNELSLEYETGTFMSWNPKVASTLTTSTEEAGTVLQQGADRSLLSICERGEASEQLARRLRECPVEKHLFCNKAAEHLNSFATLNYSTDIGNETISAPIVDIGALAIEKTSFAEGRRALGPVADGQSLAQYFERPRMVNTLDPATISGEHSLFTEWKVIPAVADVLKRWDLFRGSPEITVVSTGGSQFMGLFRIYFVPVSERGSYEGTIVGHRSSLAYTYSTSYTSSMPHIDVDLSTASTQVLRLPFPSSKNFIESNGTENDWTYRGTFINYPQLANGLTPPYIPIQIFLAYKDVQLNRLVPQGQTEVAPARFSELLAYAATVSASLPFTWTAPVSKMMELGASVAKYYGYSRPPDEPQTAVVARTHGNPALASGQPDFSFGLGLDPAVMHNVDPGQIPCHQPGDTQFRTIVERLAQLKEHVAIERVMIMTPGMIDRNGLLHYHPTPLYFGASMFHYWAGDLVLCVQIVSSPLIRWRIGVVILPPGVAVPLAFPTEGEYITQIIESAGSTCDEIVIPYLYTEPFQRFFRLTDNDVDLDQTRVMYFSLLDPTGPAATPVFPQVNYWIKAGPNFTCGVPDLSVIQDQVLIPQGLGAQSVSYFGEIVEDLLLLTRRSVPYLEISDGNVLTSGYIAVPIQPLIPGTGAVNGFNVEYINWSFVTYLSHAYFGTTGSFVYKVEYPLTNHVTVWEDQVNVGTTEDFNPLKMSGQNTSRGATVFDLRHTPLMEVRAPDRNARNFHYPNSYMSDDAIYNVNCLITHHDTLVDPLVKYWVAGGDDFMIGGFLAPIPFKLR